MKSVVAMILAGGQGSRLLILSQKRAKPAVPFGGYLRIIDFTISNVMRSGIQYVGILTQYKPSSLMDHVSNGEAWGFIGRHRDAVILPPYIGENESDWYLGTADAIYQNISFLNRWDVDTVLVLSGDHIYNMDYSEMINFHREKKADLTIAMKRVPLHETSQFGIAEVDSNYEISDFFEKPILPPTNIASLGIYVFNADVLRKRLSEDVVSNTEHDFAKNIIPNMIGRDRVFCYPFSDYWKDVGTIQSYWSANMDALNPASGLDLYKWQIRTNPNDRNMVDKEPAKFYSKSKASNSIISHGCKIYGEVKNCLLSPGVIIKEGAKVENSIIFHDTEVGSSTHIIDSIIDKDVIIEENCKIGLSGATPNKEHPHLLNSGISVIGKTARIPADMTIEKNALIYPDVTAQDFPDTFIPSGFTIYPVGS